MANDHEIVNGRFRLVERLGEGGMAVVWRAADLETGREVALKVMKSAQEGAARRRFLREFSTLVSLRHPHCLRVFEYGETRAGPYFTMELFPGRPITALIGQPFPSIFDAIRQAALALDYVHSRRLVHRDVKPSNLLALAKSEPPANDVQEGPSAERRFDVKLADFGLAKFHASSSSLSANAGFLGTLEYCAPEQISGAEIDHRADLYSFALVCYELLTGQHPFAAARRSGIPALMRAHLHESPAPMGSLAPDLPRSLEWALLPYLSKDPAARPRSTALLRLAIAECLGEAVNDSLAAVDLAPAEPIPASVMVGRDRQIEILEGLLRDSFQPAIEQSAAKPSLAILVGEAGAGKSSLLREAARLASAQEAHVYVGRCFEGIVTPFQPIAEILRQLLLEQQLRAAQPASEGDSLSQVRSAIERHGASILQIAPDLRKWLPGEAAPQAEVHLDRATAFFRELGDRQRTCLCIDDLQWADEGVLELLRRLADGPAGTGEGGAAARSLMICGTAQSGTAVIELLGGLARDKRAVMLPIPPLDADESREVIAQRLGCPNDEVSPELARRADRTCRGNPLLLCETIRHWRQTEALVWETTGWKIAASDEMTGSFPETIRQALGARLAGLSPLGRQILAHAAAIGAVGCAIPSGNDPSANHLTLNAELLLAAAEVSPAEFQGVVGDLLARRILFAERGGGLELAHPMFVELALQDISASRRAALHRRLAQLLEERRQAAPSNAVSGECALLAAHCRAAGMHDQAFSYALEAAQAALDDDLPKAALAQLSDTQTDLPADASKADQRLLWRLLAHASTRSDRLAEALGAYDKVLIFAETPAERGGVLFEMADIHQRRKEFDAAVACLDRALGEVGVTRPRSYPAASVRAWFSSFLPFLRPPWARTPRDVDENRRNEIARCAFRRLSRLFRENGESELGPDWLVGSDRLRRRRANHWIRWALLWTTDAAPQPDLELSACLRARGRTAFAAGRTGLARRCFRRSLAIAETLPDEMERTKTLLDFQTAFPGESAETLG